MSYTDPSGYFFKGLFKVVAIAVLAYVTAGATLYAVGYGTTIGTAMAAAVSAQAAGAIMIAGAAAGFVTGALTTGTWRGAITGALFGAVSAGFAYGIGHQIPGLQDNLLARSLAHGATQGLIGQARGDNFRGGFWSAFLSSMAPIPENLGGQGPQGVIARTAAAATVGGTASVLSGGKFENGAVTAAFVRLFNEEAGRSLDKRAAVAKIAGEHMGDTSYAYVSAKGKFPANSWKCNLFVHDILIEAGINAPKEKKGSSIINTPKENRESRLVSCIFILLAI